MRIGIDIDDTMTNSSEVIIEYAKKYFDSNDENQVKSILKSRLEGKLLDFYNELLPEMSEKYTLKENVKEVIDRLKEKGRTIIVISARGYTIKNCAMDETINYFNKHKIEVDNILCGNSRKGEVCLNNNVDIMIDDSILVLNEVNSKNVRSLLFTSINNINEEVEFDRVSNWLELEEYIDKIA
jgi:uncharacterized HAD superfamily protein